MKPLNNGRPPYQLQSPPGILPPGPQGPPPPPGYPNILCFERRDYYPPDIPPPPHLYRPVYREEVPRFYPYATDGRTVSSDMYKVIDGRTASSDMYKVINRPARRDYPVYPKYPVKEPYRQNLYYPQVTEERRSEYVKHDYPVGMVRSYVESFNQGFSSNRYTHADAERIFGPARPYSPDNSRCSSQISVKPEKKKCCNKKNTKTISVATDTEEEKPVLKIIKMKESNMDNKEVKYKTFWAPEKVNKGASTDLQMYKSGSSPKFSGKTENQMQKKENMLVRGGQGPLIKTVIIPKKQASKQQSKPKIDTSMQTINSYLLKSCIKKNKMNEKNKKNLEKPVESEHDKFKKQHVYVKNKDKETETNRLVTHTRSIQTSSTTIKKDKTPEIIKKSSLSLVQLTASVTSFTIKNNFEKDNSKDSNCLKDITRRCSNDKVKKIEMKPEISLKSFKEDKISRQEISDKSFKEDKISVKSLKEDKIKKVKSKTQIPRIIKEETIKNLKTETLKSLKTESLVKPRKMKKSISSPVFEKCGTPCMSRNSPISGRSSYARHMSPAARRLSEMPKHYDKRSIYKCGSLRPENEKPHNWQCFMVHEQLDTFTPIKCKEIPNKIEEELKHLKSQLSQLRNQWANFSGGSVLLPKARRKNTVQIDPGEDWIVMS